MTSSETPTESADATETSAEPGTTPAPAPSPASPALPRARAVAPSALPPWLLAVAVVPPGWFYILRIQRWHLTSSAVMLMICWVAIVLIGYFGIRMALAATAGDGEGWFAPRGEGDELEREKRSLLKAIKEIEFDRETGKLSAADAASLTAVYRARAIEVLRAIEAETGQALTVREQILADVRVRQKLEGKVKKAKEKKKQGKKESAEGGA